MKTFMSIKKYNTDTCKNLDNFSLGCADDNNVKNRQNDNINFYNKNIIITVASNKGGVGKTSITIALGMFLSQKIGRRTLLLELDSSPGDFGVLFDIEKDKSLELALRFPEKYNEFVKNVHKNLDVLKCVSNPLVAENIRKGSIDTLVDYIFRDYKCIVVDTQTVINGLVLDVLKLSDEIFIISEYSLESIARVSNLINMLTEKFSVRGSRIKLIVNKKKFMHFFKIWDISKVTEIPIHAVVKFDSGFTKSKFMFNKVNILRTRFFKEISKVLLATSKGFESYVKR